MTTEKMVSAMTEKKLLEAAVAKKYYPKTVKYGFVKYECPNCKRKAMAVHGPDMTTWDPYVKIDQVFELVSTDKSVEPVMACACGYRVRKSEFNFNTKKAAVKPAVKPFTPQTDTSVRICKTPGCNNILPADRKAKCYTCIPQGRGKKQAVTEAASRNNPTPFATVIPTHHPPVNY